ncbi:hypothetical protein Ptr902_09347 [Pyrenophora tritici-repentis]|nr:hypothetical protein Ptr902_09347 [Pyrenophora tritici-repentis]
MLSGTTTVNFVFAFVSSVFVMGTGTVNTTDTIGFVEEDNQRDTISLLISCFATLGLCVYSAVHLNVPRKAEGSYRTLLREFQWCVLGLFAPELILYTAWRQLASARQLRYEIEQTTVITGGDAPNTPKRAPWTIAHGFYGTMGGFAIDLDDPHDQYTPLFGGFKRLTLTARGVVLLTKCGHLPEVSLHDIQDKNKADGLAKLLVCVQAGWMIVQVISRAATGLPTTLLEVHVVAHVVCALIMYVLWWHKPRQVESPTVLKGEWLSLAAYMYLASRMSGEKPSGRFSRFRSATPELAKLAYFGGGEASDDGHRHDTVFAVDGRFGLRPSSQPSERDRGPMSPAPDMEFTSEVRRLAAKAVGLYPYLKASLTQQTDASVQQYSLPYVGELVQPNALDWPNEGLLRRTQSLIMGMVLWGASMAYGAIHVAAWDYFFPTALEQLFWRMSSIWVTFCAAFWPGFFILTTSNLIAHPGFKYEFELFNFVNL